MPTRRAIVPAGAIPLGLAALAALLACALIVSEAQAAKVAKCGTVNVKYGIGADGGPDPTTKLRIYNVKVSGMACSQVTAAFATDAIRFVEIKPRNGFPYTTVVSTTWRLTKARKSRLGLMTATKGSQRFSWTWLKSSFT